MTDKLDKALNLLVLQCDILGAAMSMKTLIEAIVSHPERYQPEDFAHCGLRALVSVCRDLQERRLPLQETVQAHHERVRHLSHA